MAADRPLVLGLFQKRIDGDDSLMMLAKLRFKQSGMAVETYANSPSEFEHTMGFIPEPPSPAIVHLPRGINVFNDSDVDLMLEFFQHCNGGRCLGFVLHDSRDAERKIDEYAERVKSISNRISESGAMLFIEYASSLNLDAYLDIFDRLNDMENISACMDIGHIGLKQARSAYRGVRPGENICTLIQNDAPIADLIGDIQYAVSTALPKTLEIIAELARHDKRLHFHLHDGHPLYASSPQGLQDHLSFLGEIPIPFQYNGGQSLPLMFGPKGLIDIASAAMALMGPDKLSFTLEIHPSEGRMPLNDASGLFDHWRDKTNAERMNYWLNVLSQNKRLLDYAINKNRGN